MTPDVERLAEFDPLDRAAGRPGASRARRYSLVDVFTDRPLEGNQLAVFTDGRGIGTDQMQRIARELNLSETVFALPPEQGGDVRLRIFTPSLELPFAGHPVLGSAIVIATALAREALKLETGSGPVELELVLQGARAVSGQMRQPLPAWAPYEHESDLLRALGVPGSRLPIEAYDNGLRHVYVELDSEQAVAELVPDMRALANLGTLGVSCFAGADGRFKSRMFAPGAGVPEDPATGSAAGPLAVHLSRHGRIAFGQQIEIHQGAEIGRPSLLYARAEGSPERLLGVHVGGCAVIVAGGRLMIG
jgi:trans-2,3-dihydro-3-hydroxyanthranilate isomerase